MEAVKAILMLMMTFTCLTHANTNGNVARVGNEISKPSLSGVDVPATFLQRDIVLRGGVVFAYSAYFRSDKPVWFQIWRPVVAPGVDQDTYTLVAQTRVLPAVVGGREDTYIESRLSTEKCIRVKENDRLGVYLVESPGAVSYIFDSSSPTALNNRLENGTTSYTSGHTYKFDSLVFPYDFAVAAYIDVDPSHYANTDQDADFVDCFPGVLIPDYIAPGVLTTPPPTGAPGATGPVGATGPQGPQGAAGEVGATGAQGEAGATGAVGATGAAGKDGKDGKDGSQGPAGEAGATGAQGIKGDRGESGLAGAPGKIIYVTNGSDPILPLSPVEEGPSSIFSTDTMSMSYLIWLIVLTVILIILIIVIVIIARKRRAREDDSIQDFGRTRLPSAHSSRSRFPSLPTSEMEQGKPGEKGWMDTMKDETETTYSNDTLQREEDYSNGSSMPNLNLAFEDETKASELGY